MLIIPPNITVESSVILLNIFATACSSIANIIFFAHIMFFWIFAPTPQFIAITLLI